MDSPCTRNSRSSCEKSSGNPSSTSESTRSPFQTSQDPLVLP
jgi:hypothetical protein